MKRIAFALLAFTLLLSVLSPGAAAQTNNGCMAFQTWWNDTPSPLGWFFYSTYPGTFAISIAAWKSSCAPPDSAPETCPGCAKDAAGHPISLAIGNTYIEENDIRLPGLSGGLRLDRTWNSMWPATQSAYQIGLFGPNWRSTFEERIFIGSDQYIKYGRGDGSFWSFGYTSGGIWNVAAPANVAATLVQGATYWTLTFQNGEQRLFSIATGKLVSIIDRNGNTTQLSYDSLVRLVTVTDPASRHLYFAYGGAGYVVTSVTSDVGLSLSYSYDTQGRLSLVTNPDLSTLSFAYNAQSLISSVTDSNGKILESHTYDSNGRGLTSSRANGVDAVTITYPH